MLSDRQAEIDRLVTGLNVSYDLSNLSDLKKIALDNGIKVIEDRRVLIGLAYRDPETGDSTIFIGPRPRMFQDVARYELSHEMGHVLLNHIGQNYPVKQGEAEVNYFATSLVGSLRSWRLALDAFRNILTRPIDVFDTFNAMGFGIYLKDLISEAKRSRLLDNK